MNSLTNVAIGSRQMQILWWRDVTRISPTCMICWFGLAMDE